LKALFFITLLTLTLFSKEYPKAYSSCIGCHGLKGERNSQVSESIPNKLSKKEIVLVLKSYKDGTLNKYGKAKMMTPFVKNLSDKQITTIARYLKK
jgi:cytochrome c